MTDLCDLMYRFVRGALGVQFRFLLVSVLHLHSSDFDYAGLKPVNRMWELLHYFLLYLDRMLRANVYISSPWLFWYLVALFSVPSLSNDETFFTWAIMCYQIFSPTASIMCEPMLCRCTPPKLR